MKDKTKNILLWIVAIILTVGLVIYQRSTGPTYPISGKVTIDGEVINYKLIRTFGGDQDALVEIFTDNKDITGSITLKRFKSFDEWSTNNMLQEDGKIVGVIPNQPPAGKVEYKIVLHSNSIDYVINEEPVIIRFKGAVPLAVLSPHIFLCFFYAFWP